MEQNGVQKRTRRNVVNGFFFFQKVQRLKLNRKKNSFQQINMITKQLDRYKQEREKRKRKKNKHFHSHLTPYPNINTSKCIIDTNVKLEKERRKSL